MCDSDTFPSWSQRFLCVQSFHQQNNSFKKNSLEQNRARIFSLCSAHRVRAAAGYACHTFTSRFAQKRLSTLLSFCVEASYFFFLLTVLFLVHTTLPKKIFKQGFVSAVLFFILTIFFGKHHEMVVVVLETLTNCLATLQLTLWSATCFWQRSVLLRTLLTNFFVFQILNFFVSRSEETDSI